MIAPTEVPRSGVSTFDRIDALIANPELYKLAAEVPGQDPTAGGRPRHYPTYMWVLFDALISIYGSARRVEVELAHPLVWAHLRHLVEERFPDEPDRWLPARSMRRHHYLYGRTTWLTNPAVLERLGTIHREQAAAQAREIGLLDPRGPGSWTHPHLSRMIHADGKVITPLFRAHPGDTKLDKETGELRALRAEHDASLHFEGTGETAWGTKWVLTACRSEDVHGRIILDVRWVPQPGSEAGVAVDSFADLAPHCKGAQGVIYDTALRGVHHQRMLRELGWLSVNKVAAKEASSKAGPRRGEGKRVEKSTHVEDRTITDAQGTEHTISLFAQGGAIGIGVLTDTGKRTFVELSRVRTHRNTDKTGYRWYNEYRLPDHLGGGTITVRLHGNDEDTKRRFNRTENIRPIPMTDPDFKALYRRRNDAESINRALDDTMWLRRAHSVGHERQHLDLLTRARGVNSLALWRYRRAQGEPPRPLAAQGAQQQGEDLLRRVRRAAAARRVAIERTEEHSGDDRAASSIGTAAGSRGPTGSSPTFSSGPALVGPEGNLEGPGHGGDPAQRRNEFGRSGNGFEATWAEALMTCTAGASDAVRRQGGHPTVSWATTSRLKPCLSRGHRAGVLSIKGLVSEACRSFVSRYSSSPTRRPPPGATGDG